MNYSTQQQVFLVSKVSGHQSYMHYDKHLKWNPVFSTIRESKLFDSQDNQEIAPYTIDGCA